MDPETRVVSRYGWVVVALSFSTQFLGMGSGIYAMSVVLKRLAGEFSDGDRTPILALQTGMAITTIALAPLVGRLVARGWIRPLMTAGMISTGIGLLLVARASSLTQLTLLFTLFLGFGSSTLMGVAPTTIVVNWFEERRATALGLSQLGASAAGVIMPPLVSALVDAGDWRLMYQTLGLAILCLAPVVYAVAVGHPEEKGLAPDGRPLGRAESGGDHAVASPEIHTATALRQPNLWFIAMAAGLAFCVGSAMMSHLVAFGTDVGFSAARAALLASLFASGSVTGKLVFGWLSDRIGEARSFVIALSCEVAGVLALMAVEGYGPIASAVLMLGLGVGGIFPLSSALLARAFGRQAFGPMMGLMWPITISLQLLGPVLAAWIHDVSGSYRPALWAFSGALLTAIVLVGRVRLPRKTLPGELSPIAPTAPQSPQTS